MSGTSPVSVYWPSLVDSDDMISSKIRKAKSDADALPEAVADLAERAEAIGEDERGGAGPGDLGVAQPGAVDGRVHLRVADREQRELQLEIEDVADPRRL